MSTELGLGQGIGLGLAVGFGLGSCRRPDDRTAAPPTSDDEGFLPVPGGNEDISNDVQNNAEPRLDNDDVENNADERRDQDDGGSSNQQTTKQYPKRNRKPPAYFGYE